MIRGRATKFALAEFFGELGRFVHSAGHCASSNHGIIVNNVAEHLKLQGDPRGALFFRIYADPLAPKSEGDKPGNLPLSRSQ